MVDKIHKRSVHKKKKKKKNIGEKKQHLNGTRL